MIGSLLAPRTTWYLARASGLTAWCLLVVAVLLGLLQSARPRWRAVPAAWRLDLHRFVGALALWFTGLHIGALLIDPSVPFRVVDVLVPFASRWRPGAVAWGVVGFYLLVVVEVTSLLMKHIPRKWWHRVHVSSLVLLVSTTVHGLTAGSDAGNVVVQDVLVACGVLLLPVAALRLWRASSRGKKASARRPAAARAPKVAPQRVEAS